MAGDDRGNARTATLIADYLVRSRVAAVIGHWNAATTMYVLKQGKWTPLRGFGGGH
ncbi:MAG: hypothetical protein GAK35_01308 [Herbaspirillum frisingense]|uniref:Uncharacterized protein n=1 Tax=Herbaspirillum frisingense TaxID=92645 RepID=A0A7V8FYA3_9BURK|nr:MAG: hypothetical protein GAK35_01308 [Herbaspirillum frisingense]